VLYENVVFKKIHAKKPVRSIQYAAPVRQIPTVGLMV